MYKCTAGSTAAACGITVVTGINGLLLTLVAVALIVAGLVLTRVARRRIRSASK
jgi:hypothetical protein